MAVKNTRPPLGNTHWTCSENVSTPLSQGQIHKVFTNLIPAFTLTLKLLTVILHCNLLRFSREVQYSTFLSHFLLRCFSILYLF